MSTVSDAKAIELVRKNLLARAKRLREEGGNEGNAAKYAEAAEIYTELGMPVDALACEGAAKILGGAA